MKTTTFTPTFRILNFVLSSCICLSLASACNVESGGNDTGGLGGAGGAFAGQARGFVVINTDYDSSSVSLVGLDGKVLSESFISSSSADPGLSAALGSDVVAPSTPMSGDEIVLIDRSGVLTWVNIEDAEVRAQLSVTTGFSSNPHDYVPVSKTKAYVVRFGSNNDSGREDFDAGDDVLIIDPSVPEITGSIDLGPVVKGEDDDILPRGDRAIMAGGKLRVLSIALSVDFGSRAETRLVTIDPETDEITNTAIIEDFSSCADLGLSPEGDRLAIACNGAYGQNPKDKFPDAGIAIWNTDDEPKEQARFFAKDLGDEQIGGLTFASTNTILYTTSGRFTEDRTEMAAPDTARILDLNSSQITTPIVESDQTPFNLGNVLCVPGEQVCLIADAEENGGVVHHLKIDIQGRVGSQKTVKVDENLGLPPRYLGQF